MFNLLSQPVRQPRPARRCAPWLVPLVSALIGLGAHAEHLRPLTLDQALTLAQERSRQLVAQDSAASGAREMAVAAGQLPDPTLRVSLDALPINGANRFSVTRDEFTMRTIGISQELTRDAKRKARAARFEREVETAQASRAMVLANLQRDTAIAWLERYYQERMHESLIAQRDESRLQIDAADAAYRGGRGSQADVFAARAAVALIEDRIDQSDRQVTNAVTQLARWVGDAARQPLADKPVTDAVPLHAANLEARFAHHPEIAVMLSKQGVAQAEADLAAANKKADWSVGITYAQRGPAYSDYVFLSLSVPLQWDQANRQDREVAAKLAVVEQMRAEREEATRDHVAETLGALQEWQNDRHRLERYDSTLIPLAGQRTQAAIAAYRGGAGGGLAAVLDARRAEIDTRIDRLKLEMESARLWAQLTYLIPSGHAAAADRP